MSAARFDHADYVKRMLTELLGKRFCTWFEPTRSYELGGVKADLDGLIRSEDLSRVQCAVEVEARNYKQIRGAIVDLAWHPAPKKLLVVLKAQPQLKSTDQVRAHCTYVWNKLVADQQTPFGLAVLEGTAADPQPEVDGPLLIQTLQALELIGDRETNE